MKLTILVDAANHVAAAELTTPGYPEPYHIAVRPTTEDDIAGPFVVTDDSDADDFPYPTFAAALSALCGFAAGTMIDSLP
jgi:hypothetical protein